MENFYEAEKDRIISVPSEGDVDWKPVRGWAPVSYLEKFVEQTPVTLPKNTETELGFLQITLL